METPFGSAGFPVTSSQEFANFVEIFVHDPTTADDLGLYEAELTIATGQTQIPAVDFLSQDTVRIIIKTSIIVSANSNQYIGLSSSGKANV